MAGPLAIWIVFQVARAGDVVLGGDAEAGDALLLAGGGTAGLGGDAGFLGRLTAQILQNGTA